MKMNIKRSRLIKVLLLLCIIMSVATVTATQVSAEANLNPFDKDFKLSACDGPDYPGKPVRYVVCDFNGVMLQMQVIINAMIIIGVLFTVGTFTFAGYLYITGVPSNISKAQEMFKKVGIGFIIMLSAWFIVYQILDWLAKDSGAKALLGGV